jgi:hypothetical protein
MQHRTQHKAGRDSCQQGAEGLPVYVHASSDASHRQAALLRKVEQPALQTCATVNMQGTLALGQRMRSNICASCWTLYWICRFRETGLSTDYNIYRRAMMGEIIDNRMYR